MPVELPIRAADWQPSPSTYGALLVGADDIDQSIQTVLRTPKGALPNDPQFGSDLHRYVDMPVLRATPHVVRESIAALARYEPRIRVVSVSLQSQSNGLLLSVRWQGVDAQTRISRIGVGGRA